MVGGGDAVSSGAVGFSGGPEETGGSFKDETGVRGDTARDGYGGVRQERRADQQQAEETEEGVPGPEEEPRADRETSPFPPSRLGPR